MIVCICWSVSRIFEIQRRSTDPLLIYLLYIFLTSMISFRTSKKRDSEARVFEFVVIDDVTRINRYHSSVTIRSDVSLRLSPRIKFWRHLRLRISSSPRRRLSRRTQSRTFFFPQDQDEISDLVLTLEEIHIQLRTPMICNDSTIQIMISMISITRKS